MFRPFIGEVIVGKIQCCDEFGLQGYFCNNFFHWTYD
jgi:DNA-directed RNA polymerase subunit E'/Rpb7